MEGCSICATSYGSKIIINWLNLNNISFQMEYPCRGEQGQRYRYDFYLEDLNTIIEYDGSQHFKYKDHIHESYENFLQARERDIYKHKKAIQNEIKIIRIDHTVHNNQIIHYLQEGLNSQEMEYFSNPELYDWIK